MANMRAWVLYIDHRTRTPIHILFFVRAARVPTRGSCETGFVPLFFSSRYGAMPSGARDCALVMAVASARRYGCASTGDMFGKRVWAYHFRAKNCTFVKVESKSQISWNVLRGRRSHSGLLLLRAKSRSDCRAFARFIPNSGSGFVK